jgi:hypothetical protein
VLCGIEVCCRGSADAFERIAKVCALIAILIKAEVT